jgi:hypothetical protein
VGGAGDKVAPTLWLGVSQLSREIGSRIAAAVGLVEYFARLLQGQPEGVGEKAWRVLGGQRRFETIGHGLYPFIAD